eukprot:5134175-Alexandrium_andersonii.AAC.1
MNSMIDINWCSIDSIQNLEYCSMACRIDFEYCSMDCMIDIEYCSMGSMIDPFQNFTLGCAPEAPGDDFAGSSTAS